MAITQGFAGSGGGGGGGGAVTLAGGSVSAGAYVLGSILDGAIVTLGALGDTAVGDASGSLNAHTRQIAKLLGAGIALGSGAAVIGAVTQSGTWNVTVNTALPAGANSIGTVVLGAGAAVVGAVTQSGTWNVTVNTALPAGANSIGTVVLGVGSSVVGAVTQSGTWTVQPGNTPNTTAWKVDGSAVTQPTAGSIAHGSANSGNPITEGRVAVAHGTNPTAVAAGARTDMYANRAGVPFMIGGHPNIQTVRATYSAAQTDTPIITVATGTKIVVTGFLVTLDNATTVPVAVRLGFGTVNTPTTTGVIGSHPGVAPGSGFGRGGGGGIIGVGADDADLRITTGAPTLGNIDVNVSYYTIES